jgi:hypothetical protein
MNYKGEFQGKLYINGKIEGNGVSVYLNEEALALSKAGEHFRKTNISISPFNKFMLFKQNPGLMKEGFFYEVKGTQVGGISVGPLGHPGDGEFDHRPMASFRLDVKYFPSHIKVDIRGITGPGTDGFDSSKKLSPWEFSAHFEIPKSQLQEFFQLTDFVKGNVFKLFDQVFGPA